jgi:hypothetical protein
MSANQADFPIATMARVLGVSESNTPRKRGSFNFKRRGALRP